MKLWNVFRMELFKNWHDRVNIFIMIILMCINIVGGLVVSNQSFFRTPSAFEELVITLFGFSALATVAFLFVYPYQMARTDYKNKVMSLMIASGLSRIQYYFVKVGAILIFSFSSLILLVFLPLMIVFMSHGTLEFTLDFVNFYFDIVDIGAGLALILFMWLSTFSTLMTAVIIARGKGFSIFVFFGLSIVGSQLVFLLQGMLGISRWQEPTMAVMIFQHLMTVAMMALIGILVLRKQDL